MTDPQPRLAALSTFLRVYGVVSVLLFGWLLIGFAIRAPILAEGGSLHWMLWNDLQCGAEPCHVPPMLLIVYFVWGVFFFLAARKPAAYASFLSFTMWANLAHGLLMGAQAATMMDHYTMKWFTDIPYCLVLALGIYLLRPSPADGA